MTADPKALAQKSLNQTMVTNELLKRIQAEREKRAALQAKIAEVLPVTMDLLVDNDRLFPAQREEVMAKLASDEGHVAAIELLGELAKHRAAGEVDPIGQAGTEKQAQEKPAVTRGAPTADFDALPSGQKFRDILMARGT